MDVTKHIICELTGYKPVTVDVSQGDRGSRAVSCRLLENGAPWMIPEGATARVAYTLPDGKDGLYDSRPDGTPMWEISKNIVTVELADQLMAQAGMVQMSILIIGPEGGQLATWPIRVMVCADNAARLTVPENLPPYGAGFAGKLFYGGADGTITPLGLGDGVRVEMMANGAMVLVGEGSGPSEDILTELRALADRVNAALNSDDATLDQLSEIVAYIKSNKTLIDAITTSKVSVSDIVNNLTTNVANKPLSAAQGVVLKTLIDELRQTVGQGGGTGDGAVRSVNGKTGDVTLTATDVGAMSESGANAIIINLLDEAKKSGEFDGPPGDDYVLTDADRQEIAKLAAGLVKVPNVMPVAKTEDMTQPVGVDEEGRLWTAHPAGGSGGGFAEWELLGEYTLGTNAYDKVVISFADYEQTDFILVADFPKTDGLSGKLSIKSSGSKVAAATTVSQHRHQGIAMLTKNPVDGYIYGNMAMSNGYTDSMAPVFPSYRNIVGYEKMVVEMFPYEESEATGTVKIYGR